METTSLTSLTRAVAARRMARSVVALFRDLVRGHGSVDRSIGYLPGRDVACRRNLYSMVAAVVNYAWAPDRHAYVAPLKAIVSLKVGVAPVRRWAALLPPMAEDLDGVMYQLGTVGWHCGGDFFCGVESGDAVHRSPYGGTASQYFSFVDARRLVGSDRICHDCPESDGGSLEAGVIRHCDKRPEDEVVDMRPGVDESDIAICEGVKPRSGVGSGGCNLVDDIFHCLLQASAGDSGEETSFIAKVNVRRLVAHTDTLGHLADTELFRWLDLEQSQRDGNEPIGQLCPVRRLFSGFD